MLQYNPQLKTKARSLRANPTDAEASGFYALTTGKFGYR